MEVFVPNRAHEEALALIEQLKRLGLAGRDASFLACVAPPSDSDPSARENYLNEFRFMVRPEHRPEAARLIGLQEW